jgi:hypothetical protein
MKKLLAIAMILALFLPACVVAEEQDPVVGFWYIVVLKDNYTEEVQKQMEKNPFTSRDLANVRIYYFMENGEIYSTSSTFEAKRSNASGGGIAGSWSKLDDGRYMVTLVSRGSGPAIFEDDKMYVVYNSDKEYFALRRLETLTLPEDYRRN